MFTKKSNVQDKVILEVRKIKDDLARVFGYDIKKILADARERQKSCGRLIISPPARAGS